MYVEIREGALRKQSEQSNDVCHWPHFPLRTLLTATAVKESGSTQKVYNGGGVEMNSVGRVPA